MKGTKIAGCLYSDILLEHTRYFANLRSAAKRTISNFMQNSYVKNEHVQHIFGGQGGSS
jgi:hypothetical protein